MKLNDLTGYGEVICAIPKGRRNAISRSSLVVKLGMDDRLIRRKIQEARDDGVLIINSGTGYYQCDESDIEDIRHQYMTDKARALSTLKRCKTMRRILVAAGESVK